MISRGKEDSRWWMMYKQRKRRNRSAVEERWFKQRGELKLRLRWAPALRLKEVTGYGSSEWLQSIITIVGFKVYMGKNEWIYCITNQIESELMGKPKSITRKRRGLGKLDVFDRGLAGQVGSRILTRAREKTRLHGYFVARGAAESIIVDGALLFSYNTATDSENYHFLPLMILERAYRLFKASSLGDHTS